MSDFFVQTRTGKAFDLLEPTPAMVDEEDIAHALSMMCRFNGHTKRHYSVAEHCVNVSKLCYEAGGAEAGLVGLLHDAAEAYTGDLVQPLKRLLGPKFRKVEDRIENAVWRRFGLRSSTVKHWMPTAKRFDLAMLMIERRVLLGETCEREWPGYRQVYIADISADTTADARANFLKQFCLLKSIIARHESEAQSTTKGAA